MYGDLRFLYDNFITTHAMLTLTSQAIGKISGAVKVGTGIALLDVTGPFEGAFNLLCTLEIDDVSGGSDIGQATFRWRTSNTASGQWEEGGILTRTTPEYALSADGLGTNLKASFVGQDGGAHCVVGDVWQWDCRASYGRERLLDRNRMTEWRSTGDTSESIVVDLGVPQNVTALVLHDHNLTAFATVTLEANTSDSWGSPAYSLALSVTDPIYAYLNETYRYWRITFADPSNPDGYIRLANLFLGNYVTLEQANAVWGATRQDGYIMQRNQSEAGIMRRYAYARQRKLTLGFGETISFDDLDVFLTMQNALVDTSTHRVSPLWVHLFSDEDDAIRLMEWINLEEWSFEYFRYLLNSGAGLQLDEVVAV